jgi:hypothetical protein
LNTNVRFKSHNVCFWLLERPSRHTRCHNHRGPAIFSRRQCPCNLQWHRVVCRRPTQTKFWLEIPAKSGTFFAQPLICAMYTLGNNVLLPLFQTPIRGLVPIKVRNPPSRDVPSSLDSGDNPQVFVSHRQYASLLFPSLALKPSSSLPGFS